MEGLHLLKVLAATHDEAIKVFGGDGEPKALKLYKQTVTTK